MGVFHSLLVCCLSGQMVLATAIWLFAYLIPCYTEEIDGTGLKGWGQEGALSSRESSWELSPTSLNHCETGREPLSAARTQPTVWLAPPLHSNQHQAEVTLHCAIR